MPLIESTVETLRGDIAKGPNPLFVVFSSKPGEDGKPWCGYCVKAEPDIDRVFKDGDAYALLVRYGPSDITAPGNWVFEEWRLNGVPSIYRVVDGKPALATSYEDDFGSELDAYVAGPDAWEEHKRKTLGDKYEPLEKREADHVEEFEKIKVLIAQHRAKAEAERAAKEKEAKEKEGNEKDGGVQRAVCTGDVCTV